MTVLEANVQSSCIEQNDLGLSLGLDTVSSVCVHPVWVHREIWPEQCVLLLSWSPHCVYLSVVKMPYAKWACVTALVTRHSVGPTHTHSCIKRDGYLSHIRAYKVEVHWSVYAFLTISNTWDSFWPQTIFWWSLIHLVTPDQLISGGNHRCFCSQSLSQP